MTGPASGVPGRILLVEDDPEAALFAIRVLGVRGGFDVTHSAGPVAALCQAREESWDLVITDIEMPGMTGLELLEQLRRHDPLVPVAVVTAHVTVGNAVSALRSRADEFLEKPLRAEPLIETAAALVAKGRAARQAGREVVLAIGAHPDDVEIGAGGTLLGHHHAGHQVAILTMTRGARGGPGGPASRGVGERGQDSGRRPVPGRPRRHQHQRGRSDDHRDEPRHRAGRADHPVHPLDPRRAPGPPQHAPGRDGGRPRGRPGLLLPVPVGHGRLRAVAVRRHRRAAVGEAGGHRRVRLADHGA